MALRTLTAASTSALITLAAVKLRLGITDSSQDTLLNQIIAAASKSIVSFLGRDLVRQRYQESAPGHCRAVLQLSRFPVDADSVTAEVDATAVTNFSIDDAEIGHLFRACGWPSSSSADSRNNVVVAYKAGYLVPDQVIDHPTAATALTLGAWVRPANPSLSPYLFEVTTAGTSATSAPTWPIVAGGTVLSGTAVLTARDALELPSDLVDCAWLVVASMYASVDRLPGTSSIEADGFSEAFFATQTETSLPVNVERTLERWRF